MSKNLAKGGNFLKKIFVSLVVFFVLFFVSLQKESRGEKLYIDFHNMTPEHQEIVCGALARLYNNMSAEEKTDFLKNAPTFKKDFEEHCKNKATLNN